MFPGQNHGGYNRSQAPPPNQGYNQQSQYQQGQYGYNQGPPQRYENQGPSQYQQPPNQYQQAPNQYQHPPNQQGQSQYGNAPPTHPQQFANGSQYQYSNCSGRKKALFIGINYIGTANQLNGCINDTKNVRQFLLRSGFTEDNMVVLTDDATTKRAVPTKQNILDAIQWLVKGAQPNDSLFFHYSGHGGQTKDLDGDEADGYDEVIYPLDFETNGFITDDVLHDTLVKPLPQGTRLTALFDSCHSGSALDLPYMYSTKGVLKEPNFYKEAGADLLDTVKGYAAGDQKAMFNGIKGAFKSFVNKDKAQKATQITQQTKTAPSDVIALSGCKDSQTSADAQEGGQSTGAMSYAFIRVMNENPNQSYISLLNNMRNILAAKYSQKPQLSASHPIDTNLQFIV